MRFSILAVRFALLGIVCVCLGAAPVSSWKLLRSSHFEVYSDGDSSSARSTLLWFEQLRALFEQNGMKPDRVPVRVIGFRSATEYDAYRLRPTADAYFVGSECRDYIVMPMLGDNQFPIAAHEYAHLVLHAKRLQLPPWLNEGLAEYFSTVRTGKHGWEIGSEMPSHIQTLKHRTWMPLERMLELPTEVRLRFTREDNALFYAQSWALTEMLITSPGYRSRFAELVQAIGSGEASVQAIISIYGKSLDVVAKELRASVSAAKTTAVELPPVVAASVRIEESTPSDSATRWLLADLLEASGELNRAEAFYRDLARESPGNADVFAALAIIALRKGDQETARREMQRAIQGGVGDPALCYRYAVLADAAGLSAQEIRPVLERAVAVKADFDEARYRLALLESNAGNYEAAVAHFKAIKRVPSGRACDYWSALAYALGELGKRDESKAAADSAMRYARTASERAHAAQLTYFAETDLAVQFTHDADGRAQMTTTRVPHGSAWNPFIEPTDHIRRVEGQLRSVDCGRNKIEAIGIETNEGELKLEVPDPSHVLMRNAPSEFMCGPQAASTVIVEYTVSEKPGNTAGVLRGMAFR